MISGHNTSVTLEEGFWEALKEIADDRGTTPTQLIAAIDRDRSLNNLSSAIRVFVLENIRKE
ncbi:putative DNA-binding ribbon-helix-helix protein [Labrys monachus]|uniref:DNA-binding ribbon-helix-helix protein n=1 Tax=Labrys monachus TaxID=217067 RepID=A0ABU0FKR1_9HYPH|nr:putative DNA-binding ribbon-helix-helix protein [Labrys monachus]